MITPERSFIVASHRVHELDRCETHTLCGHFLGDLPHYPTESPKDEDAVAVCHRCRGIRKGTLSC